MSVLEIATQMRAELRQHRRRTRYAGQAEYLETKDAHCARIEALVDQIVRAVGTPPLLSLGTGRRQLGERRFDVVVRGAAPAKRGAARA